MTDSGGTSSRPALVFISHEKTDTGVAQEIRVHLEADGFKCWLAPDDIRGPTPWPQQVEDAIDSCDVMVIVVSDNASGSPHVSREVDLAVEKGKPLLPVRIADVVPTGSLNYLLRLAQWIDLFPGSIADHAPALQGMVGAMVKTDDPLVTPGALPLGAEPRPAPRPDTLVPPVPFVPPRQERQARSNTAIVLAVLLFVAIAAAAGLSALLLLRGDGGSDTATTEDLTESAGVEGTDEESTAVEGTDEESTDESAEPAGGLLDPELLDVEGALVAVIGRPMSLEVTGLDQVPAAVASWSIDGVAAGDGQSWEHTFASAGRFDVVVELRAGDQIETVAAEVDVVEPLSVNIAGADEDSYPSGTSFRLQAQARGGQGPWTYTWTLPDSSTLTGEFVSDLEWPPGVHVVSVEVAPRDSDLSGVDGLSATEQIEIEIRAPAPRPTTTRAPTTRPPTTSPPPTTPPPCPRIEPPDGYPVNCP